MKRFLLPLVILLILVAVIYKPVSVLNKDSQSSKSDLVKVTDSVEAQVSFENWQKYQNTKYGYSLLYPKDALITQFEGFGIVQPINPAANPVRISDSNSDGFQLSITAEAIESFTEESIKNYFTNTSSAKITLTKITIAKELGYKVTTDSTNPNFEYYFVKKRNGLVLEIDVLKNNKVGMTILSTLSFN